MATPSLPRRKRWAEARYQILLGALLLLLLVEPMLRARFEERLLPLALVAVLLATVLAAGVSRRLLRVAIASAAVPVLSNALGITLHGSLAWKGLNHTLTAVFLALTAAAILVDVFRGQRVSVDKLLGAICAYLLIGVIWALAFSLVGDFDPQAFSWPATGAEGSAAPSFSSYTYFSFVTLTTLGYGDVAPVSEIARRLALVEALLGQLYLAVLIARLVGLHLGQSLAKRGVE